MMINAIGPSFGKLTIEDSPSMRKAIGILQKADSFDTFQRECVELDSRNDCDVTLTSYNTHLGSALRNYCYLGIYADIANKSGERGESSEIGVSRAYSSKEYLRRFFHGVKDKIADMPEYIKGTRAEYTAEERQTADEAAMNKFLENYAA